LLLRKSWSRGEGQGQTKQGRGKNGRYYPIDHHPFPDLHHDLVRDHGPSRVHHVPRDRLYPQ
jgi:hypothetical protein